MRNKYMPHWFSLFSTSVLIVSGDFLSNMFSFQLLNCQSYDCGNANDGALMDKDCTA